MRRPPLTPFISFLFLLAATPTLAQYRIDGWTTENGLPQNTVNTIVPAALHW